MQRQKDWNYKSSIITLVNARFSNSIILRDTIRYLDENQQTKLSPKEKYKWREDGERMKHSK